MSAYVVYGVLAFEVAKRYDPNQTALQGWYLEPPKAGPLETKIWAWETWLWGPSLWPKPPAFRVALGGSVVALSLPASPQHLKAIGLPP